MAPTFLLVPYNRRNVTSARNQVTAYQDGGLGGKGECDKFKLKLKLNFRKEEWLCSSSYAQHAING